MTLTSNPTPPPAAALPGVNVLLMGPSGTGKTYSIGTLVEAGLEVFYLGLEPGLESLKGYFTDPLPGGKGLKEPDIPVNLHWHFLEPPKASFKELLDAATMVNTMSLDAVAAWKDPKRTTHNTFITLLNTLNSFTDQRTGQNFGSVQTWGTDKVLVIDGLTGICQAAMSLVVGGKPVRSQADWGIAQDMVEKILTLACNGCQCHLIVLAHVEREADLMTGSVKIMASALGKALAPKLPKLFSDVILAQRSGTKWTWDTSHSMADLKTRNLPIAGDIAPNFGQIIKRWKSRGGTA